MESRILEFSAFQTLIVKCGSAIALLVLWYREEAYTYRSIDVAWSIAVWIIGSGLLATQL